MVLAKKFYKTGGSHLDFQTCVPFCDVKKPIIFAALPGIFCNDQKFGIFNAIF